MPWKKGKAYIISWGHATHLLPEVHIIFQTKKSLQITSLPALLSDLLKRWRGWLRSAWKWNVVTNEMIVSVRIFAGGSKYTGCEVYQMIIRRRTHAEIFIIDICMYLEIIPYLFWRTATKILSLTILNAGCCEKSVKISKRKYCVLKILDVTLYVYKLTKLVYFNVLSLP